MEVNIGYAWGQLVHARHTATTHADPDVQARARARVAEWERVIAGMVAGTIDVGSRTPTAAPAWVTLEVVTGGFATGGYVAGGPLAPFEVELAGALGVAPTRLALNLAHLDGGPGVARLAAGAYAIDVPEAGALPVVAWLIDHGELDRARALVDQLTPWLGVLRFYPQPAAAPTPPRATVRRQDLGATVDALDQPRRQPRLDAMHAALTVWTPLGERAIALALATCEAPPRLVDGRVAGERLGVRFPDGWGAQVAALAADVQAAGAATTARARAVGALVARLGAIADGQDGFDGAIARQVARHVAAHGAPGEATQAARRAAALAAVAGPRHLDLRRVLVARLRALPRAGGLDLAAVAGPLTAAEAAAIGAPAGTPLPPYLVAKAARSWDASLDELVAHRVLPSAEVLAQTLPQITAVVRAESLPDPAARAIYAAIYAAFRRRRGLLLVDYQHQVRIDELPWIRALEATRPDPAAVAPRASETLAAVGAAVVRGYPQTITPNKLVTELAALATAAGLRLPLVEELAADIFMGAFTAKFAAAARAAAALLAGSLYARYFAIDPIAIAGLPLADAPIAAEFAALCARRAGAGAGGHGVAARGVVIEQAQILTTHNLAVLFGLPGVRAAIAPRALAERTWRWIVGRLRRPVPHRHAELIRLKNTAYAWRQLVFYLSFDDDVPGFTAWARGLIVRADPSLAARFAPALVGLELAAAGVDAATPAFAAGGGRVFTGWTIGPHWLAAR